MRLFNLAGRLSTFVDGAVVDVALTLALLAAFATFAFVKAQDAPVAGNPPIEVPGVGPGVDPGNAGTEERR